MPNATALAMADGPPLAWAGQTALKFYGRTAVDEHYNGLALDATEGDRIAETLGDADVVFMRNHGVMVVGSSIATAWDDLYYLERACEVQRLALSTGRPLRPVPAALAEATARQMSGVGKPAASFNAWANRQSPTSTEIPLPQLAASVGRRRRISASSITSSCTSVAR